MRVQINTANRLDWSKAGCDSGGLGFRRVLRGGRVFWRQISLLLALINQYPFCYYAFRTLYVLCLHSVWFVALSRKILVQYDAPCTVQVQTLDAYRMSLASSLFVLWNLLVPKATSQQRKPATNSVFLWVAVCQTGCCSCASLDRIFITRTLSQGALQSTYVQ